MRFPCPYHLLRRDRLADPARAGSLGRGARRDRHHRPHRRTARPTACRQRAQQRLRHGQGRGRPPEHHLGERRRDHPLDASRTPERLVCRRRGRPRPAGLHEGDRSRPQAGCLHPVEPPGLGRGQHHVARRARRPLSQRLAERHRGLQRVNGIPSRSAGRTRRI